MCSADRETSVYGREAPSLAGTPIVTRSAVNTISPRAQSAGSFGLVSQPTTRHRPTSAGAASAASGTGCAALLGASRALPDPAEGVVQATPHKRPHSTTGTAAPALLSTGRTAASVADRARRPAGTDRSYDAAVREVSAKAVRGVVEVLEAAWIPVAPLLAPLPIAREALDEPAARVDWDVFVEFLDHVEAACGGALSLEDIGARMLSVPSFHFLRLAGRLVLSPRQLYVVAHRLVAPAMFSNLSVTLDWLPAGRLVITGELAPGYRESERVFRLCHANVVATPRLLDLPPAIVDEQLVTGRRGRLVLELPASHTIGARLRRGARTMFALGDAFRSVARQQAELEGSLAALRTSRHELRQLLERLPEGVLVHRGGVVVWANAAVLESLGYDTLDEVVGRHLLEFVPAEDRAPLAAAMAKSSPNQVNDERLEYRVQRPDGAIRRLQAGTVQHVNFEGARARLVVLRDVTEEHRLRDQLALAERMALLGRLAAGVAHEINNPLAYAHTSLEVAVNQLDAMPAHVQTSKLGESIARAREGTARVRGIVRDLKMLSRAEDEPGEAVELASLLDSTLALAANAIAPKATVVRSYRPAPLARATRGRLGQLFLNLLLNAADAIPDDASARHEYPREHLVRAERGRRGRDQRYRGRDPGGAREPRVRPVLHDQGGRRGDRARPGGVSSHRHAARRRDRARIDIGGRDDVPRHAAGARGVAGGAERARVPARTSTRARGRRRARVAQVDRRSDR